jgi:hypothetical protein
MPPLITRTLTTIVQKGKKWDGKRHDAASQVEQPCCGYQLPTKYLNPHLNYQAIRLETAQSSGQEAMTYQRLSRIELRNLEK